MIPPINWHPFRYLRSLDRKVDRIMSDVSALQSTITDLGPEIDGAVATVNALEQKIAAAGTPVDLSSEIAQLRAFHDSLATAVATATGAVQPGGTVISEPASSSTDPPSSSPASSDLTDGAPGTSTVSDPSSSSSTAGEIPSSDPPSSAV